jgi:hypothetical protein
MAAMASSIDANGPLFVFRTALGPPPVRTRAGLVLTTLAVRVVLLFTIGF